MQIERAWRWCVLRTWRDGRQAAARGRWIGRSGLEHLFCRRWRRVAATDARQGAAALLKRLRYGRLMFRRIHTIPLPRSRSWRIS
ncbi:MAG: hypothetical protein ACYC26_04340 [Phycisphaerales bacterium]